MNHTITERVADLFMMFLDEELIEDRREYDPEDLHLAYPELTNPEVLSLDHLVQQCFDPKEPNHNDVLQIPDRRLREYLAEFLHGSTDGWSNQEQLVILELFRDIVRFSQNFAPTHESVRD